MFAFYGKMKTFCAMAGMFGLQGLRLRAAHGPESSVSQPGFGWRKRGSMNSNNFVSNLPPVSTL